MLHLLLSTDWTVTRNEILRRISWDVSQENPGRILMVPELISHDMERRLCQWAGDTASRYAEVLSFTRLARRVSEWTQSSPMDCLDNGGRVVAMAAAAKSLHGQLKAYAAVETRPEFLTALVDAVDEFKRCRISAADLKLASEQTEGSLAQKLEELSMLLDTYDGLCAHGKRDPRDRENILLEELEDSDFAESHVIYIDGFPDFTRQHLAIISHLIRTSPEVTIGINCDEMKSGVLAFEKTGQTVFELYQCARNSGVEVDIEVLAGDASALDAVRSCLFQGELTCRPELSDRLTLIQAESIFQECAEAARRILDLVQRGSRYREISIVCGDFAAYRDILSLVFRRHGIPLYQAGCDSVLEKNVISSLLCALEAALEGFDQRTMLRYLRSILADLDQNLCDGLENYAILWGVRGNQWLMPWENHPNGLGEPWTDGAKTRLAVLENTRSRVVKPLITLRNAFREATSLSGQVEAVYDYLEEVHLAKRLSHMAMEMDREGDHRSAQILNQLWEILLSALEQLHDVLGQTTWEDDAFTRLLTLLLSQYDVGTIPPVLDAVMCGNVSAMRCQEPEHLFVLGMEEGSLPGYGGSSGVLTDQERMTLRKLGVPLTGGAMDGVLAEFSEIYGVFCGARNTITVSSATGQPSYLFFRLGELTGKIRSAETIDCSMSNPQDAAAMLVKFHADKAAEELNLLPEYHAIQKRCNHSLGAVSSAGIQGLYGSDLMLSASQVDRQGECRFSYFMKYGLRARERKEATIDPAEFGTFVHAVLEQTGRKVMELGGFRQVNLEQTMEIARDYAQAYANERFEALDSERTAYLFRRNGQELEWIVRELWQELHDAQFEPVDFETAFGSGEGLTPIPISGRAMEAHLRGFVDRVDAWKAEGQNYFRVVDYKTGRKDFDYCDVFNGIGLQMLLYLFALEREGQVLLGEHPVSAGVQYFPARVPLVSADGRLTDSEAEELRQKAWKRKGLLLNDESVLRAMEPEGSAPRLCATWKKDGTITGDLADREQLGLLRQYVFLTLGRMVDMIASGIVEPNPYTRGTSHNACSFCPYKSVCHSDSVPGRRNYKAMSAQRFWEEIYKEVDHHG